MANDNAFPIVIQPDDLKDPRLSRLNRAYQYLWNAVQKFIGDNNPGHFLNGKGAYTTPATALTPLAHDSAGEPGAIATDSLGNIYVCYLKDHWVRVGPSGTSTAF